MESDTQGGLHVLPASLLDNRRSRCFLSRWMPYHVYVIK